MPPPDLEYTHTWVAWGAGATSPWLPAGYGAARSVGTGCGEELEGGRKNGYPQTPPFPGHPSIPLLRDESGAWGSPLMHSP